MKSNIIKRVIAVIAALVFTLSFMAGCGKAAKEEQKDEGVVYETSSDVTVTPQDDDEKEDSGEKD